MGKHNFCTNCGVRLPRKGARAWLRGARCKDCALRLGSTRLKPLVLTVMLAVAAFAFGRYLRPAPPPLTIHRAANSSLPDALVDLDSLSRNRSVPSTNDTQDDVVYICGARTKKGTPCRRRVHFAGERCYQHKGLPAMVPLEKLTIKPEVTNK